MDLNPRRRRRFTRTTDSDLDGPILPFVARDFEIRDKDTVYVTEAPYSQFNKVLQAIVAPVGTAASFQQLTE